MPDLNEILGGGSGSTTDLLLAGSAAGAGFGLAGVGVAGGKYGPTAMKDKLFGGGEEDHYASDLLASITRGMWDDYKDRFLPIEDMLIDKALNPDVAGRTAAASQHVNKAYDVSGKMLTDKFHSYGLEMTPEQKKSYGRQSNLSRGLADVQAQNRTRANIRDEQMQILTGLAPRSDILPQGGGGLT